MGGKSTRKYNPTQVALPYQERPAPTRWAADGAEASVQTETVPNTSFLPVEGSAERAAFSNRDPNPDSPKNLRPLCETSLSQQVAEISLIFY